MSRVKHLAECIGEYCYAPNRLDVLHNRVLSFPRAAWECSNSAPRCTTQLTQSYQQARMELTECGAFRDDATVTRVALSSIRARKLHGIHVIYAVHCCSTRRVETAFPRGAWERVSV